MMSMPPVVFEIGLNHLGDPLRARRMIDTLAQSRATHLTLQVLTDPARVTRDPATVALLGDVALPIDDVHALLRYATDNAVVAGATLLDEPDVPRLVDAGARFFKILSSDLTYVPLILAAARTGFPTYLSTAAATMDEIADVLRIVRTAIPKADLRLIHTVLEIPTPVERINLRNISLLRDSFGLPVAYGQHSNVHEAVIAAAILGVDALFIYVAEERTEKLPDGPHAVLCEDVAALLESMRRAVAALGSAERLDDPAAGLLRRRIRRSAVAARSLRSGEVVTLADVVFRRPGTGVEPYHVERILGQKLPIAVAAGDDIPARD